MIHTVGWVVLTAKAAPNPREAKDMLWLLLGVVLLVIAIAGGAIVHPILFALAIIALVMFFGGFRGRGATY
jgi:hypothetical protein